MSFGVHARPRAGFLLFADACLVLQVLRVAGCFWNQPELFEGLRQLTAVTQLRCADASDTVSLKLLRSKCWLHGGHECLLWANAD
jgi:hypothetical protein